MKGEVYLYHCKAITGMTVAVDDREGGGGGGGEVYLYHSKVITLMMVSADEGRGVPVPLQGNNGDDGCS